MVNTTHNRKYAIGLLLLLVASSATAVILWKGSSNAGAQQGPIARYAVLDRPQTPGDRFSDLPVSLGKLGSQKPDLDVAGGRVIHRDPKRVVALIPSGPDTLCLTISGTNGYNTGTCDSIENANGRGLAVGLPGMQVGVVPDDVSAVLFTLVDGSTVSQDVVDNIYWAPANAANVTFVSGGQKESLPLLPAGLQIKAPEGVTLQPAPGASEVLKP